MQFRFGIRMPYVVLVITTIAIAASACGNELVNQRVQGANVESTNSHEDSKKLRVITSISPIRSIAKSIGGDRIIVSEIIPEGINAHTFEPPPSATRNLSESDLVLVNGLNLELPIIELAKSNVSLDTPMVLLGERTIGPDEYVYDFSFPRVLGNPNPHLWTAPNLASKYGSLIANALSEIDPKGSAYYKVNLAKFQTRVAEMDRLFSISIQTIPEKNRRLLTYHDSFPFFGNRYGLEIIGAIQPSNFSDPSPSNLAKLIKQIRDLELPAIFGSVVFESEVLSIIADAVGTVEIHTLSDDDLPGERGDLRNTYFAMMTDNVRTIVNALGGTAKPLDGFDISQSWIPESEFNG